MAISLRFATRSFCISIPENVAKNKASMDSKSAGKFRAVLWADGDYLQGVDFSFSQEVSAEILLTFFASLRLNSSSLAVGKQN
jgi:hypothetical protein